MAVDSTGRCNTLTPAGAERVMQMKYRTRTYYTSSQKALMWERWKEGWTLHQIAHLFKRAHTSVRGKLARTGGFRPSQRIRSAKALTLAEREEISRSLADGWSLRGSPRSSGEHHQRSAANWAATVDRRAIALPRPTMPHGTARFVPSRASWSRTRPWPGSCRTSFGGCDRRSRSQDGSSLLIHATRACTCHTRPSTAASSFKRAAP